jgi:putative ABC transport system permease protein
MNATAATDRSSWKTLLSWSGLFCDLRKKPSPWPPPYPCYRGSKLTNSCAIADNSSTRQNFTWLISNIISFGTFLVPKNEKIGMFKNYFTIAWRNFKKDRQFTLLNLLGLSTGLASALLILLWVNDEWQMDKFNQKDSRLYQVLQNWETPRGVETTDNTPGPLANALQAEMPEVEYAVPVIPVSWFDKKGILTYGDTHIEASPQFVGKDYLNVFSYPLLQGDKGNAFPDKSSILISKQLATQLFKKSENVIGKTLTWNQKDFSGVYSISGVFEKPQSSATSQFDVLFDYALFLEKNPNKTSNWGDDDPSTYLVLKKGTSIATFNSKIAGFLKVKNKESKQTLFIQKYSEKYLHNHYENGAPSGGRIQYVKLFSIVAIFILIIACINFMNLSTAKAVGRMKEAGMKKVMGASRMSLIVQYLGESLLMALLSMAIAIFFVYVFLPRFNEITGKQLSLHFDVNLIFVVLIVSLVAGIISGIYPALYLSGFKPAATLKGQLKNSVSELFVRKGLVVFQFAISSIFIISVLVIYKQMQLIQTKNLGYNRDHVIYFDKGGIPSENKEDYAIGGKYEADLESFVDQVRNTPGVVNAANFRHNITNRNGGTTDLSWPGKNPNTNIVFTDLGVGNNFIETMGIEMKEGRTYSGPYPSERSKIIFNELAIERMGLKNPIGKRVRLWGEDREIIGVTKNFNFQSLYENLKPCFFDLAVNQRASKIIVRIKSGQETQTIDRLEKLYKQENQGFAFEYKFLDEDYQALYTSERRVAALSRYFAGLAAVITCLGLFGLATFTAQRRRKEIGIRKVVGATVANIVIMLSTDFLQLVLVAVLIAFPLSWWAMNRWLHDFAYRVNINAGIFLIAAGVTLLITIFTIAFQAVKAAIVNPASSLKAD